MNEAKVKKKKKKRKINKIITLALMITFLIFFCTLFYLNIIPLFYILIILFVILSLLIGIMLLNLSKKKGCRIIGYFLSAMLIIFFLYAQIYLSNTLGFLFSVTDGDYSLNNYNLLILRTDEVNNINILKDKTIGISETSNSETLEKAIEKLDSKIDSRYKKYEDTNTLVAGILNNEVEAVILEDSELDLLKEQNNEKYESLKIIYEIEIKNDIKDIKDTVNINKEPFNIYISGIDTYGKINSSSRSDVNMILTVNPKKEKILITWIPRDYYLNINNSNYKDKLTHAGIYGVDSSIFAIENLLNIDINYYVKVNFTSLIKIVDLLGGITICNDEAFTSIQNNFFEKGNIILNGEKTLEYVRERKNISDGDIGRGRHQIMVLEALIEKAMSPSIIKKYNSLLNALDESFVTNMGHNTMLGFIKKEIQSPRNWQIESFTLTGTDSLEYTYTYKKTQLYVMIPNNDVVKEIKVKLKELNNK